MHNPISAKKVILGGIITGMILNIIDAPNGALLAGPAINRFLLAHQVTPNPLVVAYFFPFHLLYGMMIVWTYAAFIPQFGATRRNALLATLLLCATTRFMALGFVVMGLLPWDIYCLLSATMVLGSFVGGLTGCWYYSRRQAMPAGLQAAVQ